MTAFVRDAQSTFTATGEGGAIDPLPNQLPIVFTCTGTFVGTVDIEFRHGAPGQPWFADGTTYRLTAPGIVFVPNPGPGIGVRMNCTAFTSGTINGRITHQEQK